MARWISVLALLVAGAPALADDSKPPGPPPLPSTDPSATEPAPNQPPYPAPPPVSLPAPLDARFVLLDRQDASSRAGLDVSYVQLESDVGSHTAVVRLDPHLQYVDRRTGAGGYVQLPVSLVGHDGGPTKVIGGLELGGLITRPLSPEIAGVLHVGLVLPTASDDDPDDAFASLLAGYARPADYFLTLPETTLRLGFSPVLRIGALFGRADLGADRIVTGSNDVAAPSLAHINVALGLDIGTGVFALESSNIGFLGELPLGETDRWQSVMAISARIRNGSIAPYFALVFPVDEHSKSFLSRAVTLGIDAELH